mgnify:CR=1 FL=1|tara:strand:- start:189 stop:380 length:192 start_codon:yes stop_codon:yes gene_type:complete
MGTRKNPLMNEDGTPKRDTKLTNLVDSLLYFGRGRNDSALLNIALFVRNGLTLPRLKEYLNAF